MLECESDVPAGQEVVLVRLVVEHGPHEVLLQCGEAWQEIFELDRKEKDGREEEINKFGMLAMPAAFSLYL